MSFREAFTKSKEQLLNYDDNASLYFGGATLLCLLTPFSIHFFTTLLSVLKGRDVVPRKSRQGHLLHYCRCSQCAVVFANKRKELRKHLTSASFLTQALLLILLIVILFYTIIALSSVSEIQAFNPFDILGLSEGASDKSIKKAYRTLSLKHHPDKNLNDPSSAAKFMLIAKAYQSLTDELARENYEKYGNPDGPGAMKVGIGLPHFLVDEDNQALILAFFLVTLIFLVPFGFLLYYHKTKLYYPNGVRVETVHFFGLYLNESTRARNAAEFLAATAESQEQNYRPKDLIELTSVTTKIRDFKKPKFTAAIIRRNYILILAHIYRLHDEIPARFKPDLEGLLRASPAITESILKIAFIHNWLPVVQSIVKFRRGLIQALDVGSSSLLQIPHFNDTRVDECNGYTPSVKTLREYLDIDAKQRPGLTNMTANEQTDVLEFCSNVSRIEIATRIEVIGESEIVEGDLATLTVTLHRLNLKQMEAAGPVHAPYFPDLKFETWWLFLIDRKTGGLQSYVQAKSQESEAVEEFKFLTPRAGSWTLQLIAMCDSYDGIDIAKDIDFMVLPKSKIKREIFVHPDDEALDNQPTLFQQMLGDVDAESSDGESDGE